MHAVSGYREAGRVAVVGASGFVGRALCGALTEAGDEVVAIARGAEGLASVTAAERVAADVRSPLVEQALADCQVAYYLVHSLGTTGGASRDEGLAASFAAAARRAGVERVVFLGAPAKDGSVHLESRSAVAAALETHGPPLVELEVGAVLGPGSMPYELLRACVEAAPVVTLTRFARLPTWASSLDAAITALLSARTGSIGRRLVPTLASRDMATLLRAYAEVRGLSRLFVRVPGVPHRAVAAALSLLARIMLPTDRARAMRELIASTAVALDGSGSRVIDPASSTSVLRKALQREAEGFSAGDLPPPGRHGGVVSVAIPSSRPRAKVVVAAARAIAATRRGDVWASERTVVLRPRGAIGVAAALATLAAAGRASSGAPAAGQARPATGTPPAVSHT
jgi:uncharacterized protein YbjT (DUF2867 family)